VVPAISEGTFHGGELLVTAMGEARAPIDRLLRSMAEGLGGQVAAVILAGRGADGVIGIKRVKEAGGLTIAQVPDGDETEMPRAAIATGMIDLVLPLGDIAARLATFGRQATETSVLEEEPRAPDGIADTPRHPRAPADPLRP
jgi:two-component system, chemotaxis family, CheB/CheR fusion protein